MSAVYTRKIWASHVDNGNQKSGWDVQTQIKMKSGDDGTAVIPVNQPTITHCCGLIIVTKSLIIFTMVLLLSQFLYVCIC